MFSKVLLSLYRVLLVIFESLQVLSCIGSNDLDISSFSFFFFVLLRCFWEKKPDPKVLHRDLLLVREKALSLSPRENYHEPSCFYFIL